MLAMVLGSVDNFGLRYLLEIVGLVFVLVFIGRRVVPPLRKAMNAQAESIRVQLAAGDEAKAAAEQVVARRKVELEQARDEAATIVAQAKSSAAQLVEEGRRRADQEYERLVARAALEIEQNRARARDEVSARIAELVVAAAEQVVEAELDETMQHSLISQAIAAAETEER